MGSKADLRERFPLERAAGKELKQPVAHQSWFDAHHALQLGSIHVLLESSYLVTLDRPYVADLAVQILAGMPVFRSVTALHRHYGTRFME